MRAVPAHSDGPLCDKLKPRTATAARSRRQHLAPGPWTNRSHNAYPPNPIHQHCPENGVHITLVAKARAGKGGTKFVALFDRGDTRAYRFVNKDGTANDGHSEADQALCCLLAFWTNGDAARMDRLFRQSALCRAKWEREDYRRWTIEQALQKVSRGYSGVAPSGSCTHWVRVSNQLVDARQVPDEAKLLGAIVPVLGAQATDEALAAAIGRSPRTVAMWRTKLYEAGLERVALEAPTRCYATVPKELLLDHQLSVGARVTALAIARTMRRGVSRAGLEALANLRGSSYRQVIGRHVQSLEAAGYFVVLRSSFSRQLGRRESCSQYLWGPAAKVA